LQRFEQSIEAHNVRTEEINPPVQNPQACCACPEIILDHIKLHSMKFPKPRELKNNDYPDLQEDEPTLLRNLMHLARPSEGSHIDMYLDSTIKFV
ncbi:MAG: hypothetical protein ACK53Y_02845, partial [bacterium]